MINFLQISLEKKNLIPLTFLESSLAFRRVRVSGQQGNLLDGSEMSSFTLLPVRLIFSPLRHRFIRDSIRYACTKPTRTKRSRKDAPPTASPPKFEKPPTYVSSHFRLQGDEVMTYLTERGISHRRTSTHAIVEICPFCHNTKRVSDNHYKLYISRESGAFFCHRCKASGSWFSFRNRLSHGDHAFHNVERVTDHLPLSNSPLLSNSQSADSSTSKKHFLDDQLKWSENLWQQPFRPVLDYLVGQRGLSESTLRHFGVGAHQMNVQTGDSWRTDLCMTFPMYDSSGTVVRHKVRSIRTKSGMRLMPRGGSWGLFGLQAVPSSTDEVVLTEGELDAMSVWQMTGKPAISLPNGASSLPVDILPMLERFQRIVLWMDADAPGDAGARQFSRKLGLTRVRVVPSGESDEAKDANDLLLRGENFHQLISRATTLPHDGVCRFDDLRESVFEHLKNKGLRRGIQCQSIPKLNSLLKGHRPGELTILSGHTGIGKTTLLTQLSLDYCMQGVPTIWGSFEIGNVKLAADMLTQMAGALGERGDLLQSYDSWADRLSELPLFFMKYHGSSSIDMIMDTMEYCNYVYDSSHYVLDNLQFMTYGQSKPKSGRRSDKFEVMDEAISRLRTFCSKANVHVSLVVHPRKENDNEMIQLASVFGSAKATQEADNVVVLQRAKDGIAQLDVKKNRYDGVIGNVKLCFDRRWKLFKESDRAECAMKMTVGGVKMIEISDVK